MYARINGLVKMTKPSYRAEMKPGKKRLRQQRRINRLRERDGDTCCYCGVTLDFRLAGSNFRHSPSIEHVHSQSDGGPDALYNLKLAHVLCNERVGNLSVAEKTALMAKYGHTCYAKAIPAPTHREPFKPRFDQPPPPGTYVKIYRQ